MDPAFVWNGDWSERKIDYAHHVHDLRTSSYEGAVSRQEREAVFCRAFDLVTPVARRVLAGLNETFLRSSGQIHIVAPERVAEGGLIGSWQMSWPALQRARNRFDQSPLSPVALSAVFPLTATGEMQWTHPHFAIQRSCCRDGFACAWPMQVTSHEDACRQEPTLRVMAEAEMHQKTYLSDLNWRILVSLHEEP
jgi:hypothetical protein